MKMSDDDFEEMLQATRVEFVRLHKIAAEQSRIEKEQLRAELDAIFNAKEKERAIRKEHSKMYREAKQRGASKQQVLHQQYKIKCMNHLGSKCNRCGMGYDGKNGAAFEFHHKEPKEKKFLISTHYLIDWEELVVELNKCELLCKNCHGMIHSAEF